MSLSLAPRHFVGRIAVLVVALALVQFAATLTLYNRISRDSVREDHARRVAELLEVSERLHARGVPKFAEVMSTRHLQVWQTAGPHVREPSDGAASQITALVQRWEPGLQASALQMDIERVGRRENLTGSMALSDGSWLNFRSTDLSSAWPIVASSSLITLLLTLLCLAAGAVGLRQIGVPFRRLAAATNRIGVGQSVILKEDGPPDIRNLSHAFNAMQGRIAQILGDQTKAMVGLSHDLRTPLSRLNLCSDFIEPEDMRTLVRDNVGEMEALIVSLQGFLNANQFEDQPRQVSLAEVVAQAGAPWRDHVTIAQDPEGRHMVTYPLALRQALAPLIENAVHYGSHAEILIEGDVIWIRDRGPGIAEDDLPKLIEPFFRADAARGRTTAGFGLGIPTAHTLLQRFDGTLDFGPREGGGLEVRIGVPQAIVSATSPGTATTQSV